MIVPWDLDATWGRNALGNTTQIDHKNTNRLFKRLQQLNPQGYNQRLVQRWNELRLNQFSESNLLDLFSADFEKLNHYQIIETENTLWQQSLNITQEEEYIKAWIIQRLAYLDSVFL